MMENCSMRIDGFTKDNTSLLSQRNMDKKGVQRGGGGGGGGRESESVIFFPFIQCSGVITSISQSEVSHCVCVCVCVCILRYMYMFMQCKIQSKLSHFQIWVKRLPDNSKLRIYLTHLTRGKYVLKRRSA